jgi:hypothetical protein
MSCSVDISLFGNHLSLTNAFMNKVAMMVRMEIFMSSVVKISMHQGLVATFTVTFPFCKQ